MKICFTCDLHLPFDVRALQYDVLDWAIKDIVAEKPGCIIFAGDATCDGNADVYEYFVRKMKDIGLPFLYIPGNSDLRDKTSREEIIKLSSPCRNDINGIRIYAINDGNGVVKDSDLSDIEGADDKSIVFMHHPLSAISAQGREKLLIWRARHPKTKLFYGHLHSFSDDGNSVSLPTMDPDKSIGESPCIVYYDTDTERLVKSHYNCPIPADLPNYLGISCYSPEENIRFAIDNGIKNLELRPNVLQFEREKLVSLIFEWRKRGGTNLSIHLSEVFYGDNAAFAGKEYDGLIDLGIALNAERYTQHVPVVNVQTILKDGNALGRITDFIANKFKSVPENSVIGVENMHMTKNDESDSDRRFGYTPEETLEFMRSLSEKCHRKVGINFDVGHARNNSPFSQKYQISTWFSMLGEHFVGYHIHQVKEKTENT